MTAIAPALLQSAFGKIRVHGACAPCFMPPPLRGERRLQKKLNCSRPAPTRGSAITRSGSVCRKRFCRGRSQTCPHAGPARGETRSSFLNRSHRTRTGYGNGLGAARRLSSPWPLWTLSAYSLVCSQRSASAHGQIRVADRLYAVPFEVVQHLGVHERAALPVPLHADRF
jgi:hypothetical protein